MEHIVGIVLAGGRARRMGGADKAMVVLAGRTLLDRVIGLARPQVSALAISANGDPRRFDRFGLPVLADDLPGFPGPLAGILPPALLDTPLGFRELQAVGAGVGHGGVVAFDEATPLPALAEAVFAFGADESCGECTPCRLGAREVRELLARRRAGRGGGVADRQVWDRVTRLLRQTSLCGLGGGLGEFAASVDRHYTEEWNAWWS